MRPTWNRLVRDASEKGLSIVTAESCTGGRISSSITDVPGASACYKGGMITYSDDLKRSLLGVDIRTLERYGAVSRETAVEMSEGLLTKIGGDLSLAVTGIAGPSGGTPEKPVGTVYIAISVRDGNILCEGFLLEGLSREEFKYEVGERALGMLSGIISSLPGNI